MFPYFWKHPNKKNIEKTQRSIDPWLVIPLQGAWSWSLAWNATGATRDRCWEWSGFHFKWSCFSGSTWLAKGMDEWCIWCITPKGPAFTQSSWWFEDLNFATGVSYAYNLLSVVSFSKLQRFDTFGFIWFLSINDNESLSLSWQGNESNVKSKPFEVQGCWEGMDGWKCRFHQ